MTNNTDPPRPPTRYDYGLAEFPAFRFGTRRRRDNPTDIIRFTDTIRPSGESPIERQWTVYPSLRAGYGGQSTQALLFDLHQVWRDDAFKGTRIYFGTLRKLYQRRYPGHNPSVREYAQMRRDLSILCDYSFDCVNSFWDPVTRTYGTITAWHLFTGWYEAHRARPNDPQHELPFGFIEVSDTFARIAAERGFFATGFSSTLFHSLSALEQRLALYLSKMFVSQKTHWRRESEIYAALPIEGTRQRRRRQTLRDAAQGLIDKGYPNLASFTIEKPRGKRSADWIITFHRRQPIAQERPQPRMRITDLPESWQALVQDIVNETDDPGSIRMWVAAIRGLGVESVRAALADLRAERLQRAASRYSDTIRQPGAWLTTKLMAIAQERGITITRHKREPNTRQGTLLPANSSEPTQC